MNSLRAIFSNHEILNQSSHNVTTSSSAITNNTISTSMLWGNQKELLLSVQRSIVTLSLKKVFVCIYCEYFN
jgi:hypothetical protein